MINHKRLDEILAGFSKLEPMLVLGDVGIDKYTYGDVARISPEAPVPILKVSREWCKLGLASNVSDNLKSLGIDSTLCSVVGNDVNGTIFENLLEERDLKTWGIVRDEKRVTTFKERVTTNTQQICRVDYEVLEPISNECHDKLLSRCKEFSASHSMLILEDYAKGLLNADLVKQVIAMFKEQNKMVAVDPYSTCPVDWYKGATLFKPNLTESISIAKQLGYMEVKPEVVAEILLDKLDLQMVVITLGNAGMAFIERNSTQGVRVIPTLATEVYDVSGAGDTAISALCAAVEAGATLEEAVWIANCASGVVVGKRGTASVTCAEITKFHKRLLEEQSPLSSKS